MEKKIKEVRLKEVRALEDAENEAMKIEGYAIVFDDRCNRFR